MPKPIKITLDTSRYVAPTEADIREAKRYILHRNDVANELQYVIADLLQNAAVKIVRIAYKYNFPGEVFTIGASPEQQQEINAVMDELEQKILERLEEMILDGIADDDNLSAVPVGFPAARRAALLAFMLSLGHGNRNLRSTLFNYEWRFLYDLEAAIAALKLVGTDEANAITRVRSSIGSIYTMSEVQAAIKRPNNVMAEFLRTQGVPHNPDGTPNLQGVPREGYNAIINSIRITNDIVWGHNQFLNFVDRNAAGFYVLRGSDYRCKMCDDNTGFHHMSEQEALPPLHPHCQCYAIPIFENI